MNLIKIAPFFCLIFACMTISAQQTTPPELTPPEISNGKSDEQPVVVKPSFFEEKREKHDEISAELNRLKSLGQNDSQPKAFVYILVGPSIADYTQFKDLYGLYVGNELAKKEPQLYQQVSDHLTSVIQGMPENSYDNLHFAEDLWMSFLYVNQDGLDYLHSIEDVLVTLDKTSLQTN